MSDGIAPAWSRQSLRDRLRIIRRARTLLAERTDALVAAISPELTRSDVDTLTAEVLPLLDSMRFLERNARGILAPRTLRRHGRPFWLWGVFAKVERVPFGHILVLGPANFPLFLPGVQVMQALAAGNAVTWKPGAGGALIARCVATALYDAGLPRDALHVTEDTLEAAEQALAARPDKVIFTGSSANGAQVLGKLAGAATPAVVELSGADAVFVLPGANLSVVARSLAFGLRLNGGRVCMAPRRLFASGSTLAALLPHLRAEILAIPPTWLSTAAATQLKAALDGAQAAGAVIEGEFSPRAQHPLLIRNATPQIDIAREDIFAPVLSFIAVETPEHALTAYGQCPYALTASIFSGPGDRAEAVRLGSALTASVILHNDLIAPTADPRLPFGGRGASGFGVTRGAEGLLEMTAIKTTITRHGGRMRHLDPQQPGDASIITAIIRVAHEGSLSSRWKALAALTQTLRSRR